MPFDLQDIEQLAHAIAHVNGHPSAADYAKSVRAAWPELFVAAPPKQTESADVDHSQVDAPQQHDELEQPQQHDEPEQAQTASGDATAAGEATSTVDHQPV